jgi:hypothetical protein
MITTGASVPVEVLMVMSVMLLMIIMTTTKSGVVVAVVVVLVAVGGGGVVTEAAEFDVHLPIMYAYCTNKISVDQCHLSAAGLYGTV